jgi:Nucleotidyl transferase AbiEii toxin, Type IV TA system
MNRAPGRKLRNVGASVRDRLTQRARANADNVQLVLTRYAIERLLYRLSVSPHRDRFILKGAMLFGLWSPTPYRATGDLDLLGYGDPAAEAVVAVFRQICTTDAPDDGVTFMPDTVQAEVARAEDEYSGLRVTLKAVIGGARLPMQVDIGFGDAVTPAPLEVDYPSLLDLPTPRLCAYPPETVVAEKVQAIVALGMLNSRMKDFFDLWAISQTSPFDGPVLGDALQATFTHRATLLPAEMPIALTQAFANDAAKQAQWRAFIRRAAIALAPEPLPDLLSSVAGFVAPPLLALGAREPFVLVWRPGGPWVQVS